MVQTIASRLAEKDAKHADEYYANAKAYDAKLAVLEEKINSLKSLRMDRISSYSMRPMRM